ncbi:MAG: sulfotransferase domain-containing protein [Cyanobacteria bacterium J06555_13]
MVATVNSCAYCLCLLPLISSIKSVLLLISLSPANHHQPMNTVSENCLNHLPNALIIGVQKSATTWLSKRLSQHPDIYMVPGEVHYFDHVSKFARGLDWYASLFKDATNESVRCEKSGAYFWTTCTEVIEEPQNKPERIKQLLPEAKLMVVLREPVSRAISGWNHNVRSGTISPALDINKIFSPEYADVVRQHGILTRGLYYQQMSDYLEHFDSDQILVLFFETDVLINPMAGLRKAARFLEIDSSYAFAEIAEAENKLQSTKLGVWASYFSGGLAQKAVHKIDRHFLRKLPLSKWQPAYPNAAVLAQLQEYYKAENEQLTELIGELPRQWTHSKTD